MSKANTKKKRVSDSQCNEDQEALNHRRDKLLSDIKALKLLISNAEAQKSSTCFKDVVFPEDFFPTSSGVPRLPDPQIALQTKLHALAGFSLKKVADGFAFGFGNSGSNTYWIQLCSELGDDWRVGRWILPTSIDAAALVREFPLDSPAGIKLFLRECKRRIDCYEQRKTQCEELEAFLAELDLQNCSVQTESGFTRVILKVAVQDEQRPSGRVVVVDLRYRSNENRPTRIIVENDDPNLALDEEESRRTRLMFKAFKDYNLKQAAVKIFRSEENAEFFKARDDSCDIEVEPETERRSVKRRKRDIESEQEDEIATSVEASDDETSGAARSANPRKRKKPTGDAAKKSVARKKIGKNQQPENEPTDNLRPADSKGVKKSAKKSAKVQKIGKNRKPENESADAIRPTDSKGVKKSAKKSPKVQKIGKNRQPENESAKENSRVFGKKSAMKSPIAGQSKLSRFFSSEKNRQESEPRKVSKDVTPSRVSVAIAKSTKGMFPCSTPIVGRATRPNLDDDISEIVRVRMTKNDRNDEDENDVDDDESPKKTHEPRDISNQTELLRDVRAVHFAIDHIEKPPKRNNKVQPGARRKSAIKKR